MAPADAPELVVGVVMDEPRVGARDGGMVSAPVFREIAQQILTEMKVPTDATVQQESLVANDIPETPVKVPSDKKPADGKSADKKSETTAKPKVVAPAGKEKPIKKTNEKNITDTGRLTAFLFRRFNIGDLTLIDNKIEVET